MDLYSSKYRKIEHGKYQSTQLSKNYQGCLPRYLTLVSHKKTSTSVNKFRIVKMYKYFPSSLKDLGSQKILIVKAYLQLFGDTPKSRV